MTSKNQFRFVLGALVLVALTVIVIGSCLFRSRVLQHYEDADVRTWRTIGLGILNIHGEGFVRHIRVGGHEFDHISGKYPGFIRISQPKAILFYVDYPGFPEGCKAYIFKSHRLVELKDQNSEVSWAFENKPSELDVVPIDDDHFQLSFLDHHTTRVRCEIDLARGIITGIAPDKVTN